MARSEARLSVEIWTSDADFRALSRDAQWMFMFLLSQHDLAHDGVLALRVRRWSQCAANTSAADLMDYLAELERGRFVVVDHDAEELLIRSFIRRDKVFRQPNVLRAAADHLSLVTSDTIRYALAVELARVSVEPMPEGSAVILAEMRKALPDPSGNPPPNPSAKGSANPSGNPSAGTPGERGVVTEVEMVSPDPVPRDPRTPDPVPPSAGTALTLVPSEPAGAQGLLAEWLDHCRKRPPANVIGQVGKQVKALLAEGQDHADVRAGLAAWHQKGLHPSALPSVVNEFMNAGSHPARAAPRPSTTDQRVADNLALAARFEAQEDP